MGIHVALPDKFQDIFAAHRYKAYYGGRGSGKSHTAAQALLIAGMMRPIRVLCCREIQNSIKDSVKRLLDDKINQHAGMQAFYTSTLTEIRGLNGTLFTFAGLRSNPDAVKSTEGIDIAWVEEANRVSQRSIDLLTPTVRKEGSEIWFTWNPEKPTDPVDNMFRGGQPPPNSVVVDVNYFDNPWFPEVLRVEMEWDKSRDQDKYEHVWLGHYLQHSEARVFRNWRVENFTMPEKTKFYYGGDFGFARDPSAAVRIAIDKPARRLYIDYEAYGVGVEIDYLPALFAGRDIITPPRWPNPKKYVGIPGIVKGKLIADSARPETIAYLRRRGFTVASARKGKNSIVEGVEFIQNYDVIIHERCTHVIDEFKFYSYKIDKLTEEVTNDLEDKNNHTIDSVRYALENVRRRYGMLEVL